MHRQISDYFLTIFSNFNVILEEIHHSRLSLDLVKTCKKQSIKETNMMHCLLAFPKLLIALKMAKPYAHPFSTEFLKL